MKMEPIVSSETSAIRTQTPGNYPKRNKLRVYTCLTQLYGGRDMYNLLHKDQLHVSALFIGHLKVDN